MPRPSTARATPAATKAAKTVDQPKRKPVVPPSRIPPNMNLFEYLSRCKPALDRKIVDIALAQAGVPPELKADAAQEIYVMWSQMKPDTARFKPGQIASYAHRMAKHAALRLRREIGSSVRLPGSAFRKRADGSSYVTPGILAVPLSWEDLESWMNTDELVDSAVSGPHGRAHVDALSVADEGQPGDESDAERAEQTINERQALLEQHRCQLSERQYAIISGLVQGKSYDEIQAELGIKRGVLMREVAIASTVIGSLDA
jgi:DNA-directed RNA polymerase specialized sigma24 family protein